jgi:hypothetical protein
MQQDDGNNGRVCVENQTHVEVLNSSNVWRLVWFLRSLHGKITAVRREKRTLNAVANDNEVVADDLLL